MGGGNVVDPGTSALVTTGSPEPTHFLTARANSATTNPKIELIHLSVLCGGA
jgi:hypothetical protein